MVDILATTLELVPIGSIAPHPDNPRVGDVEAIAESMEENGNFAPLGVQVSTRFVLIGNHRLLAARLKGMAEVPVVWLDVDDDRARRIMLADNRASDRSSWDDPALADLLVGLRDETPGGLTGTGYDEQELDALLATLRETTPSGRTPLPPLEVAIRIGTYSFTVTPETWEAFDSGLVREAGTSPSACVEAIRERLAL